ncbi:PAS/PAC sensor hybrid histidine kinase [Octadecabacter temperatus]|uniref:histidine kinase n=1 Tax=Octadecabacter temperatus TaxID=1458307 RepID=A0A0K0Y862_9RHOB|nr:PAS domain-containing hybrid sensor histidine kinase/response regulator [Octadecabacter temperatus]AKS47159.1 Sensor protein EvgS precursor [Octadecabacter temperatus]SIO45847.1 PAS/PAC sensor hybrid histidine kinase [Octadecabacter temperatus]
MKLNSEKYRLVILAGLGLLSLLLVLMVTNLLSQLRDLSTAQGDSTQWSISQLDTEFANLNADLSDQLATGRFSDEELKLRIDITLSRLDIVNSGRAALLIGENAELSSLIRALGQFEAQAISISDSSTPLTNDHISELLVSVTDLRPNVRKIALLGLSLSAEKSQQRRALFAEQLKRTGSIAIVLLVLMGALLMLLDRMFRQAAVNDAALQSSAKLLSSTVTASLDGIVTANSEGEIIDFNLSAEKVFGWSRSEMIGKTMEETFIPHHMRDAHHNGMRRYLETGKPRVVDAGRVELSALRKSGEEFPVELNITATEDEDGTKFIAYIRDISERKIAEQELVDARDRAEKTDKAKSQFLTLMSHEMRTPLNGIMGVLDLLKTTKLSPAQERYADIALASSEILLEHTNEALDITRIETGNLKLAPQQFDLPEMVNGLVDVLEPLAREKNLDLNVELDDLICIDFYGDSNRIRQILTNLIGNAIKFSGSGEITVQVGGIHGPEHSSVKFKVSDTGPGIAPEHQEQVFDDFVALAPSEGRQSRGDGLGLAISRKIARRMDGDISLNSEVGIGSTFTLTVPLQRREEVPNSGPAEQEPVVSFTSSCKVLVVEDNSINRKVLSDMLEGMGHHVTQAINGADCIEKAALEEFDAIIMDISMPIMNGIEATRRLRHDNGPNAATRIVGLTAHGREEYREEAEQAGMNRFHTKPIRLDALRTIIAELSSTDNVLLGSSTHPDALGEMRNTLGAEKASAVGKQFFDELKEFDAQARDGAFDAEPLTLAEVAHKMKGAASLFGFEKLEIMLQEIEHDARLGSIPDLSAQLESVENLARKAEADFDKRMSAPL